MGWDRASFGLGILICAIGILLMVEGSILGERTVNIATVLVLVGICLLGSSGARSLKRKKA